MCNKNGNIINTFFKVAKESKKLWNYKISIEDLSKIYSIFFRDIPIKLKIFIKNQEIIRLSIIPYHVFSKDLLGKKGVNEIMTLTARIFNAMGTSSREIKNYYKVPPRSTSSLP